MKILKFSYIRLSYIGIALCYSFSTLGMSPQFAGAAQAPIVQVIAQPANNPSVYCEVGKSATQLVQNIAHAIEKNKPKASIFGMALRVASYCAQKIFLNPKNLIIATGALLYFAPPVRRLTTRIITTGWNRYATAYPNSLFVRGAGWCQTAYNFMNGAAAAQAAQAEGGAHQTEIARLQENLARVDTLNRDLNLALGAQRDLNTHLETTTKALNERIALIGEGLTTMQRDFPKLTEDIQHLAQSQEQHLDTNKGTVYQLLNKMPATLTRLLEELDAQKKEMIKKDEENEARFAQIQPLLALVPGLQKIQERTLATNILLQGIVSNWGEDRSLAASSSSATSNTSKAITIVNPD